jgi:hypothetical protein
MLDGDRYAIRNLFLSSHHHYEDLFYKYLELGFTDQELLDFMVDRNEYEAEVLAGIAARTYINF